MWVYVSSPKNLVATEPRFFGIGIVHVTRWNTPLHHTLSCRIWSYWVTSYGRRYRGFQKYWGRWRPPIGIIRASPSPYKYARSHVCYCAEFSRSSSNGTRVRTEISRRNWAFFVLPFKVTQCHGNQHGSICEFLLVICSNHAPISYRFVSEINSDFGWKSQFFPTPSPSLTRFTWEFCNTEWGWKNWNDPPKRWQRFGDS